MPGIRDKVTEEMLQFIRHGYMPESMVKDILSIRELATVDRKADLPKNPHEPSYYPDRAGDRVKEKLDIYSEAQQDMVKEGWVKEVT